MANETKLINAGNLKAVAQGVYTKTQANLAAEAARVNGIIGEAAAEGKKATGLRGEIAAVQDEVDALEGLVGDVTEGKTVMEAMKEADEALTERIDNLHKPQVYNVNVDTEVVDSTYIEEAVAKLKAEGKTFGEGDIIVIKEADGVAAAYQFDGDNVEGGQFEALAGKVNAANVMFKKNITLAGNYTGVGNLTKNQNGTATLESAGKSVMDVFMEIFTKTLQPGKPTEPSVTLTFSQAKAYEVGTDVTPSYSASLSAGSYQYGPKTGITAQSWSVSDTAGNSATTPSGSFPKVHVTDSTNYKITAKATHNEGAVAKNNVGGDSKPVVKIDAGEKSKTSGAITGFRYMFCGSYTEPTELTSANIRALATKRPQKAETFEFTVQEGAKQVIVAVPSNRKLTAVFDKNASYANITGNYDIANPIKVQVDGATAGADATEYNVYVFNSSVALSANSHKVTIQ